ncbi:hypothetical protein BJV82DRAFT_589958, partial [Fennellomyces sp. T-0311]
MNFSLWWGSSPQSQVSLIGYFAQSARALDGRLQLQFPKVFVPAGDYYHIAVIPGSSGNSTNSTATPEPENLLGPIKYYAGSSYGYGGMRESLTVSVCPTSDTGSCGSGRVPSIHSNEIHVTWTNAATDLTYDSAEVKLHWGSPVYYVFNGPWNGEITYNQVLSGSPNGGQSGVDLPIAQDLPPGEDYYVVVSLKRGNAPVNDMGIAVSAVARFVLHREEKGSGGGSDQGSTGNGESSGHTLATGAIFIFTAFSAIVSTYFV